MPCRKRVKLPNELRVITCTRTTIADCLIMILSESPRLPVEGREEARRARSGERKSKREKADNG